jgi:hypothetical protein
MQCVRHIQKNYELSLPVFIKKIPPQFNLKAKAKANQARNNLSDDNRNR